MTQSTETLTTDTLNYRHLSKSLNPAIFLHLTPEGREANIKEAHALLSSNFHAASLNTVVKLLESLLKEPLEESDQAAIKGAIDAWNTPKNNPQ